MGTFSDLTTDGRRPYHAFKKQIIFLYYSKYHMKMLYFDWMISVNYFEQYT